MYALQIVYYVYVHVLPLNVICFVRRIQVLRDTITMYYVFNTSVYIPCVPTTNHVYTHTCIYKHTKKKLAAFVLFIWAVTGVCLGPFGMYNYSTVTKPAPLKSFLAP